MFSVLRTGKHAVRYLKALVGLKSVHDALLGLSGPCHVTAGTRLSEKGPLSLPVCRPSDQRHTEAYLHP